MLTVYIFINSSNDKFSLFAMGNLYIYFFMIKDSAKKE